MSKRHRNDLEWDELAAQEIAEGDLESLQKIRCKVQDLDEKISSRMTKIRVRIGNGVVLVKSYLELGGCSDPHYDGPTMQTQRVSSTFTVGPRKAHLSVEFSYCPPMSIMEDGEGIAVDSQLCTFRSDKCSDFDYLKISNFLTSAGLEERLPLQDVEEDITAAQRMGSW